MSERRIGVIINGATGRMGTTQHMANLLHDRRGRRAAVAQRRPADSGAAAGRARRRIACKALAAAHGDQRWTTSLDEALRGPDAIFMDCAATGDRPARVRKAIAAGKHIHIEKPTAPTVEEAMELARAAHAAGVKHGVIQDKLYLPGFAKLLFVKERRFLRPDPLDPHRCRIVDIRRQDAAMPAAELELQARRGRRYCARYDGALALHDRPPRCPGNRRVRADVDGDTRARGRDMGDATRSMRRIRRTRCCDWKAAQLA